MKLRFASEPYEILTTESGYFQREIRCRLLTKIENSGFFRMHDLMFPDLAIRCQDKKFLAHKFMLCRKYFLHLLKL